MNEELDRLKDSSYKLIREKQENESDSQAASRFWTYSKLKNNSIIFDLFYGQFKKTVTCMSCNKSCVTFEHYSNILLEIPVIKKFKIIIVPHNEKFNEIILPIPLETLIIDLPNIIYNTCGIKFKNSKFLFLEKKSDLKIYEAKYHDKISLFFDDTIYYNEIMDRENNIYIKVQEDLKNFKSIIHPRVFYKNSDFLDQIIELLEKINENDKLTKPYIYDINSSSIKIMFSHIELSSNVNKKPETRKKLTELLNNNSNFSLIVTCNENFCMRQEVILNSTQKRLRLEDCFYNFRCSRILSDYKCPFCQNCKNAITRNEIYKFPHLLIVCFKRFFLKSGMNSSNNLIKDETNVEFPIDDFNMDPYIIGKSDKEMSIYSLYAVSNHMGKMEYGHYTAFAKSNRKWFYFNDSRVYEIREKNINSENAYMLFYRRK